MNFLLVQQYLIPLKIIVGLHHFINVFWRELQKYHLHISERNVKPPSTTSRHTEILVNEKTLTLIIYRTFSKQRQNQFLISKNYEKTND